ncbi:homocysteine S-methyltransferase family protein [Sulfitobacter aestuariivivens]|nr:homocysteine S-methyltransferase family protein [Sulfitobacter aestuariivivens]
MADFGIETAMIFHEGLDLPHFAAFTLYGRPEGRQALGRAAERSFAVAKEAGTGLVLDAETWRANLPWGAVMDLGRDEIAAINAQAVTYARMWRDQNETAQTPVAVNGVLGPLGDGYVPETAPDADEATMDYLTSARAIAVAGADLASAITMTSSAEATGAARAMRDAGLAHAICFTVETDGRLPSGETVGAAIDAVDAEQTEPLFYGINCAHPAHFADALDIPQARKIGMIRANASRLSHVELDAMDTLDAGDPEEWGQLCAGLAQMMPWLRLIGGCCGTDHRHLGCAARCLHGQKNVAA